MARKHGNDIRKGADIHMLTKGGSTTALRTKLQGFYKAEGLGGHMVA
jgi:hypothetical protein